LKPIAGRGQDGAVRPPCQSQIPESYGCLRRHELRTSSWAWVEYFEMRSRRRGPSGGVNGWESDLFAGLPVTR